MISLQDITLRRGAKLLLEHASATIFARQKVGVIGLNGCGKSSLFSLLLKRLSLDGGELFVQSNIKIAYLSQEVPNTELSALQYVMQGDQEPALLMEKLKVAEKKHDGHLVSELHNRLYEIDGYALESRAAKLLIGLGFSIEEQQKSVNSFSGGWQMRLNLAQVLMSRADLLLLDEPTNYLDLDAIVWLEKWLQNFSGTLLLISHDRVFLDNVVERVIYIGGQKLEEYAGNYSSFEKQRAEHLAQEQAIYKKQLAKRDHLAKYIDRFRYKASKARQAQSRIKMLEKMDLVSITRIESPFSFKFSESKPCGNPLISMNDLDASYGDHKVLSGINFSLGPEDAIGILGINGAGKSTFMKTLAGILNPSSGNLFFNKGIKIGYFAQHQVDQLDMQASPLTHILRISPEVREQQVRTFLGSFGFRDDMVLGSVANFSGGEKARLVLAILIWQKPNLLLLDEPTNHLDLNMRTALTYALQEYTGALVLVAHDRYLLKAAVNEFYLVNDGKVNKFAGDLDDYQQWLLAERKKQFDRCETKKDSPAAKTGKEIKENSKEIRKLEQELKKLQLEKDKIASTFSDSDMYEQQNREELASMLKKSAAIEMRIKLLEEKWFEFSA